MSNHLCQAYPRLAEQLPRIGLAELPTPLQEKSLQLAARPRSILVKRDDLTAALYGGNKIRKLEYLLQRARDRGSQRIATFGTVASNHALATTLYATAQGFACTCFLSHQARTSGAPVALNMHLRSGTRIVAFGGSRPQRIRLLREHLQQDPTWVIPMGGSCWLGALGFVNAGIELAAQVAAAGLTTPDRLYVANGTMGTAAGLALGVALAGLPTEVHAVRVTHNAIASPVGMRRLVEKTATLMHRYDPAVPADIASRVRLVFRDSFFAGGYARSDAVTDAAVASARDQLGLRLETTYTGKAFAALLHDAGQAECEDLSLLFWNTFNSRPLPATAAPPTDRAALPAEFLRYFD